MLAPATTEADRAPIRQSLALGAARRDPAATGQTIAGAFRRGDATLTLAGARSVSWYGA
jgi:hypothetical protein